MDVNQMHATNIDLRDWIHDKYLVDSANVVAEAEIPNALTEEFQSLQTSNLLSMNNVAAFPPATELNRELAKNPTSAQNCSLPIQEDIENCTQVQQQVLLGEWTIDSKNQSSTARFNTLPDTHNVSAVLRLTPRAAQRTLLPAHADSRDERNIVCGLPTVLFSTSAKTRQGRQQRRQKLFREIKWESQQFTRRRRTEAAQQNRKKLSSLGGQCHRCMKGKKQCSAERPCSNCVAILLRIRPILATCGFTWAANIYDKISELNVIEQAFGPPELPNAELEELCSTIVTEMIPQRVKNDPDRLFRRFQAILQGDTWLSATSLYLCCDAMKFISRSSPPGSRVFQGLSHIIMQHCTVLFRGFDQLLLPGNIQKCDIFALVAHLVFIYEAIDLIESLFPITSRPKGQHLLAAIASMLEATAGCLLPGDVGSWQSLKALPSQRSVACILVGTTSQAMKRIFGDRATRQSTEPQQCSEALELFDQPRSVPLFQDLSTRTGEESPLVHAIDHGYGLDTHLLWSFVFALDLTLLRHIEISAPALLGELVRTRTALECGSMIVLTTFTFELLLEDICCTKDKHLDGARADEIAQKAGFLACIVTNIFDYDMTVKTIYDELSGCDAKVRTALMRIVLYHLITFALEVLSQFVSKTDPRNWADSSFMIEAFATWATSNDYLDKVCGIWRSQLHSLELIHKIAADGHMVIFDCVFGCVSAKEPITRCFARREWQATEVVNFFGFDLEHLDQMLAEVWPQAETVRRVRLLQDFVWSFNVNFGDKESGRRGE